MRPTGRAHDFLFKTIVVGDGAVGKTAITIRFATGKFQESYKLTIGVDFSTKIIKVAGKKIKCQIWDTGGQERFSYIRPLYYRGALGCIVVYDVTNWDTFTHLDRWFSEVIENCGIIPMLLVGNKIDLSNRVVSTNAAKKYATEKSKELKINIPYLESSALTGETIEKIFFNLAEMMVENTEKPED